MNNLSRAMAMSVLLALSAGAAFFAFWSLKVLMVVIIPGYMREWQTGTKSEQYGADLVFLGAIYLVYVCCRSAWAVCQFLNQQSSDKASFKSLLRAKLF
jgi:hypothetical protein